jgi:hypothetical protein
MRSAKNVEALDLLRKNPRAMPYEPSHTLRRMDASLIRKGPDMLWTICAILIILWLLGLVSGYTMGGVIHVLLVIAIIAVLIRVIQGRRLL